MKKPHVLAITLGAAVLTGTAFAASGSEINRQSRRVDAWLTIPAVYDSVTAAGYGDIIKIESEKNGYEVKALGPGGEHVKLYVDPINGEVLDVRPKRDKRAPGLPLEEPQVGRDYHYDRADR